ncbi:MAG: hypothetical protein ACPG49_03255 [Chitinophagales bacterium]
MTTVKLQIQSPDTLQKILAYVTQFEDIELQTEQEDLHDSYKMSISTLAKDWDTEADQRWDNYEDYE